MNTVKKTFILSISLIFAILTFIGCIPIEYTQGVMLHTDYPQDDFPLIDDAVVYYCDKDDNDITIRYGTKEKFRSVVKFYKELFKDKQILLSEEDQKDSRYTAKGCYKESSFFVKVYYPSGDYEKQLYTTTVRIKIEPCSDDTVTTQERIIGFWRYKRDSSQYPPFSIHFLENGTAVLFDNGYYTSTANWRVIDETTFSLTLPNSFEEKLNIAFESDNGKDYMRWDSENYTTTFYRDLSVQDLSNQLTNDLGSYTWYFVHYMHNDGEIKPYEFGRYIFNLDGTFKDELGAFGAGTWFVSNELLFCDNNGMVTRPIKIEDVGSIKKFFLYDEYGYWLFINGESKLSELPEFANKKWHIYSKHPDNEYLITFKGNIDFSSHYMLSYFCTEDSTSLNGSWYYDGEKLYIFTKDETIVWNAELKANQDGIMNLCLEDLSTDYDFSNSFITDTPMIQYIRENEPLSAILTAGPWNSQYHSSSGDMTSMTRASIEFNSDGTFTRLQQDETVSGIWGFEDGVLHMEYPTLGEVYDYPDTYIKVGSSEGITILMMGDDDGGYFKYTLDD